MANGPWKRLASALVLVCLPFVFVFYVLQEHAVATPVQAVHAEPSALASAEREIIIDWRKLTVADLLCYAARYEDVRQSIGFAPTELLQHYATEGQVQGRDPRCHDEAEMAASAANPIAVASPALAASPPPLQHQQRSPLAAASSFSLDVAMPPTSDVVQRATVGRGLTARQSPPREEQCHFWPGGGKVCLPMFLVIGAQKSGTSTLAHLMGQHPQIIKAKVKELLFFNWNNDFKIKCNPTSKELAGYRGQFPALSQQDYQKSGRVTGEFSATYLPCHCCAAAVHRVMPKVRVIAILRHPIDRAHSRFVEQGHFAKRMGKREINNCPVWMGWEKFVDHAVGKLNTCFAQIPNHDDRGVRECIHHNNEVGWSIYAPSLRDWIAKFGRDHVQVVYTDDMKSDPLGVLHRIENHVGLNNFNQYKDVNTTLNAKGRYGWNNKDTAHNRAAHPAVRDKMPGRTYDKLHEFYSPWMNQLQTLVFSGDVAPMPESWSMEWGL